MNMKTKKNIMKTIITSLVIACSLLPFASKGQTVTAGMTGGIGTGAVKIEDAGDQFLGAVEGRNIMGYEAGAYMRIQGQGAFYVRPQLMYNFQTGTVNYQTESQSGQQNYTAHKIQAPLFFGLQLIGPLSVEAGPVYNYVLHHTESFDNNEVRIRKGGLGYRVGPALNFERFTVNMSYEGITHQAGSGYASFSEPGRLIFGLGVFFGTSQK